MGVPWNPEWDERINQLAQQAAALHLENALSDGTLLSQMTPGTVPSITSTAKVSHLAFENAPAAHATFTAELNVWRPMSPDIGMTAESGGRPVLLVASGGAITAADAVWFSLAVNGTEVTNTQFGMGLIQDPNNWQVIAGTWLLQSPPPRFRVQLVGRRSANTAAASIGTSGLPFTILAVEV